MEQEVRQQEFTLLTITPGGKFEEYSLNHYNKENIYVGRDPDKNDICLNSSLVSHTHGLFTVSSGRVYYEDLNSSNGTYVDLYANRKYLKNTPGRIELRDGMILNIGGVQKEALVYLLFSVCSQQESWKKINVSLKKLTIGRAGDNDIVLSHPAVSRHHATVFLFGETYYLTDDSKKNGVHINGKPLSGKSELKDGDVIQIMSFQLIFMHEFLFYKSAAQGIGLIVKNLNKKIDGKNGKILLNNVNCRIESNEFVAIVGGSGAGKTTLMNAISGFDQKTTGHVILNGLDLKTNFKYLKALIGYVPQEDIIYENLTLKKMLEYTARLKMREDTSKEEREAQIQNVLQMVDLTDRQDTCIRKLSGGQKKRASIAVELLADPKLFFLDEPTSGLDPGTEQNLMRTLNRLSKVQDKTIIMVTHTIQNLHLCDRIIFMGKGGRLCFSGTLKEAQMFFDTDNLADAYDMVSNNSKEWEKQFSKFQQDETAVSSRLSQQKSEDGNLKQRTTLHRQWFILVSRYMELIRNDLGRLMVLLLQPVIIGLLLYMVADDSVFDIYETTKTMMFALCCSAIWIGLFNSIQEICKERNILKREYMGNLNLTIYILSKFFVQALIGLIQTVLLAGVFLIAVGKNISGIYLNSFVPEVLMTLWLVILASEAMGFLVSANARSGDKAMVAAPFLLIIQLLFSGILFKLTGIGKAISVFTVSRWAVEALGSITGLNELPLKMQADYPMIEHKAEELFEATGRHLISSFAILLIMTLFLLITSTICLRQLSKDSR